MGVSEMGDGAGFFLEAFDLFGAGELGIGDFDGGKGAQAYMFAEVNFCEAAVSQKLGEAIVAKALAGAICHVSLSLVTLAPGGALYS